MPTRIATWPLDDLDGLKALLRTQPEAIEDGFRMLETDLEAGRSGTVDLFGVDRRGAPVIVALAGSDPAHALLRLLDQYCWAVEQHPLLCRAYPLSEAEPPVEGSTGPHIRLILVASRLTSAFVERLSLLSVEVEPLMARRMEMHGAISLLLEPAAALFGLDGEADSGHRDARPSGTVTFEARQQPSGFAEPVPEESPMDEAERLTLEALGHLPRADSPEPPSDGPGDRSFYPETLTPEEFEEFERFENERRARDVDPDQG